MSENEILRNTRNEFDSSAPDDFAGILDIIDKSTSCDDYISIIHNEFSVKNIIIKIVSVAAAITVVFSALHFSASKEPFFNEEKSKISVTTSEHFSETTVTTISENQIITDTTTVSSVSSSVTSTASSEVTSSKSVQITRATAVSETQYSETEPEYLPAATAIPETQPPVQTVTTIQTESVTITEKTEVSEEITAPVSEPETEITTEYSETTEETTQYEPQNIHAVLVENPLWRESGNHTETYFDGDTYRYKIIDIDRYRIKIYYDDTYETFSVTRAVSMGFLKIEDIIEAGLPYEEKTDK